MSGSYVVRLYSLYSDFSKVTGWSSYDQPYVVVDCVGDHFEYSLLMRRRAFAWHAYVPVSWRANPQEVIVTSLQVGTKLLSGDRH